MRIQNQINSITHLLRLSTDCLLCHIPHRDRFAVCARCDQSLLMLGPSCQTCASPIPDSTVAWCGACCFEKPSIDHVYTVYRFEEPLRTVLHEFKYHEGLYLTSYLSKLMQQALPNAYTTECLIPVPMHPKQLKLRGFNQSILLAKYLSSQINYPVDLQCCKKIINTPKQATLDAKTRRQNLENAFYISAIPYQHVTLVDDLITTGSTANEIAKRLKQAGARRVDLICCAKA